MSRVEAEACVSIDEALRSASDVYARTFRSAHGLMLAQVVIAALRAMEPEQLAGLFAMPQPCPDCGGIGEAGCLEPDLTELRHTARFAEIGILSFATPPVSVE